MEGWRGQGIRREGEGKGERMMGRRSRNERNKTDREEREGCVWWTGVGAGIAYEVIQATLLLLACHNPSPWLPATATSPELD